MQDKVQINTGADRKVPSEISRMSVSWGLAAQMMKIFKTFIIFLLKGEQSMKKKEITHWSPEEELNYNFFLICKAEELSCCRNKPQGFYVEMSKYIASRDKVQCRSHHEKMVARGRNKAATPPPHNLELENLRAFYHDHVSLRLLDSRHLMKEIEHQLAQKVTKGKINKKLYQEYREKAEQNLPSIELQDSDIPEEKPEAPSTQLGWFHEDEGQMKEEDEGQMKEEAELMAYSLEGPSLDQDNSISALLELGHTAPRTLEDFDSLFEEE